MSSKSYASLVSDIASKLANNTTGLITALKLRELFTDFLDSVPVLSSKVRVHTASGGVTLDALDNTVVVKKATSQATLVTLPASPVAGVRYMVKDGKGDSAAYPITFSAPVDGNSSYALNTPYGEVGLYYDGAQWVTDTLGKPQLSMPKSVLDYGAKGDGTTDDTAAIQAAITAAGVGGKIILPAGYTFLIQNKLIVVADLQTIVIDGVLKAGASMSGKPMIEVLKDAGATGYVKNLRVTGSGVLDGALVADKGIDFVFARDCHVDVAKIVQVIKYPIHCGSHATKECIALAVTGTEIWWHDLGSSYPNDANSIGVFYDKCQDSRLSFVTVIGYRKGFKLYGAIHATGCHAWNRTVQGPLSHCFETTGSGNIFVDCYADTPMSAGDVSVTAAYGFYFGAGSYGNKMTCCRVFINHTYGQDNLATGVHVGQSGSGLVVFGIDLTATSGCKFKTWFGGGTNLDTTCTIIGVTENGQTYNAGGKDYQQWVKGRSIKLPAGVALEDVAGNIRSLSYATGTVSRFDIRTDTSSESGSNAGCNLEVIARNDAGSFLYTPLKITRSSGLVAIGDPTSGPTTTNIRANTKTQTTVGAAGGGSALPATPTGYLVININGTDRAIPYYAVT